MQTLYDEGAPNADVNPATGTAYGLPTTTITQPLNAATQLDTDSYNSATGTASGLDAQISHTGYAAIVTGDTDGWTLGQATSSTTQMGTAPSGSNDLVTQTRYNSSGQVVESRLPNDTAGSTPRTTDTSYYTATGTGTCVSAVWAGLVCQSAPAAQPATGSPLPVVTYSYDQYGEVLTKTETVGTGGSATVRTTTDSYDAGGRLTTSAVTVANAPADNTTIPAVSYSYDTTTGLPTTTGTGSGGSALTLTSTYDNLGQVSTYTDATGTTSTRSYDIDGRLATVNDGQGTVTYTYDSSTEHRGVLTGEDIGVSGALSTFAASYDPSGALATETYPNGLVASTTLDNAGNPTALSYTKSGSTWMAFTATVGDSDSTVAAASTVAGAGYSSQGYGYDQAGRLLQVQDTYAGTCTTRVYTLDAHANRSSLVPTRPAAAPPAAPAPPPPAA